LRNDALATRTLDTEGVPVLTVIATIMAATATSPFRALPPSNNDVPATELWRPAERTRCQERDDGAG
jgi:hypothetical protein